MLSEDKKVIKKLEKYVVKNSPIALVIVVDVAGSSPRGVGSMMLVDEKGKNVEGTVGGGILEEHARKQAVQCIKEKKSRLISFDMGNEKDSSNLCGGETSIFIKVMCKNDTLVIAGAGHIGQKLAQMASILGYNITVLDNREELLVKDRFPESTKLLLGNVPENLRKIPSDYNTNIVILTYAHKYDQDCLQAVIDSNARYIGMIGSRRKINTCFKNLLKKGVSKEKLAKVYTPIGLDIGGQTPEEIALSILAEIQAVKYKKDLPHIKDKQ